MGVYSGLFLTALATLIYEVTLLRILSVMSWYHLAFFAISTAILTREDKPIGKLYAADLTGAAFGCLVVIFGLERLSAPDLILLAGPWRARGGRRPGRQKRPMSSPVLGSGHAGIALPVLFGQRDLGRLHQSEDDQRA